MRAGLATIVAATALLVSACGSVVHPDPEPQLFREYTRSNHVENDRFPTPNAPSARDRVTTLASIGSAEDLLSFLTSPVPCLPPDYDEEAFDCRPNSAVRAAAKARTGSENGISGLSIIVKHSDNSLELITLYVAGEGRNAVLIDDTGQTYSGDLTEFLDENEILEPDDIALIPERMTATGGGRLLTVYGQTEVNSLPWILGGTAVLLVGGVLVGVLRERARRRAEATPADPSAPPMW